MSLDLTDDHRYNPDVHFRRYLDLEDTICVICVQDFDYRSYDSTRFLDRRAFAVEDDALAAPLDLLDMINATTGPDAGPDTTAEVLRTADAEGFTVHLGALPAPTALHTTTPTALTA
ncbi:hypothetical protein [Streptacidiphilus sp. EB103A]|uniref:hypothetical protein n=1 Tax=Streptacidiphilus sp. EB103A TaxID=3156275 RepID=UPI003517DD0E